MESPDPTLRPERQPQDADRALRPQALEEFIGQQEARANLRVFIESARMREEAMDHVLFTCRIIVGTIINLIAFTIFIRS